MTARVNLEGLYRASPVWVQNGLASLEGWRVWRRRYGPRFEEIASEVDARWTLIGDALVELQARRLTEHLHAAALTPFWRSRFAETGVRSTASDPFGELAKLPVLRKAEVQANTARITNPAFAGAHLRSGHTSGTTGAGLVFPETADADRERWAVWWRYRKQFGLTLETPSAVFAGRSVVPPSQSRPPFWRKNLPGRQLLLSAYHLSESTVESYWAALRDWGAPWLHGYPSFLTMFAELAEARGLPRLEGVRWITTGAENLLASQRRVIESAFGAPVRQHYGLAESVANVSEREDGRYLVDEDFSFVEFVPEASGAFRLVGTNWSNPAFPLLRYDTGDLAEPGPAAAPGEWRVVRGFDGRQEDYLLLPNGARVGRLDHIFKDLVHIAEAQIHQRADGRVTFRIVKGPGYDAAGEEERLLRESRDRLGDQLEIGFEYVAEIPRTRGGKLRFVVSDRAAGALDRAG